MATPLHRLAKIGNDVCVERAPSYWATVAEWEDFRKRDTNTKIFLVQHALVHGDDFEYDIKPTELL